MRTTAIVLMGVLAAGWVAGRPWDIRSPNLEPPRGGKPRPPVMVPPDATTNLALGCRVTASAEPTFVHTKIEYDTEPLGGLPCVTDGEKELDAERVSLPAGTQWVQIDLGKTQEIWAICIWHEYGIPYVYHDVVVQLSSDLGFTDGVVTVFNNDHDNSSGLGIGADKEYIETNEGRFIAVEGLRARYLRFYSKGNVIRKETNRYIEIEVYGRAYSDAPPKDEPRVPLKVELPKPGFM